MSNLLESLKLRIEPLIQEGKFGEILDELNLFEATMHQNGPIRQQSSFYRAVVLAMSERRPSEAQELLNDLIESLDISDELRMRALNLSALIDGNFDNHYSQALRKYQQVIDTSKTSEQQSQALFNQAIIYNNKLNNPTQALDLLEKAENLLQQTANKEDLIRIWNEQGLCQLHLNQPQKAKTRFEQVWQQCNADSCKAVCAINLGRCEQTLGNYTAAQKWYKQALGFYANNIDDPLSEIELRFYLGQISFEKNEYESAEVYFREVLFWAKRNNNRHFAALANSGLGQLSSRQN